MKMEKRQFRIGQLAQILQVEQFVIRFWEKEFQLSTARSTGGQRFYSEKDLLLFNKIKQLLYEGGFTIAGAKKQLRHGRIESNTSAINIALKPKKNLLSIKHKKIENQLISLQKQLIKLRSLL